MSSTNEVETYVSSSTIVDLDIDCLEELFEWLSLCDLRALRATCKRMKIAVNYYVRLTYPKGFGKLEICDSDAENLQNFDIPHFCQLYKHIEFSYCPLSDGIIDGIAEILKKNTFWCFIKFGVSQRKCHWLKENQNKVLFRKIDKIE